VLKIPPLRERKSDIPLFIEKFLSDQQIKLGKYITVGAEAEKLLLKYDWPGNIREFKNAIEYASGVVDEPEITLFDLPQNIIKKSSGRVGFKKDGLSGSLENIIAEVEKDVLHEYLLVYGDDGAAKRKIAEELNLSVATLYNKIKKYKLSRSPFVES
jgi:transcriptional regulator with PAS, ATPase and Fis domain